MVVLKVWSQFTKYLKKHDVLALAIGFMIAKNLTKLTQSAVNNVFNPIIDPILKYIYSLIDLDGMEWNGIKLGKFTKDFIEFVVLGIIVLTISNLADRIV